jgi:predicted HD superfamily hydrolase involved in NAD metabolism
MMSIINAVRKLSEETLSGYRFRHVVSVAETAVKLAARFNVDSDKAHIAGLGHDIAKELLKDELIRRAESYGVFEPWGDKFPAVLHGRVAGFYIKEKLGFYDAEVDSAMYKHTGCGRVMTALDKILVVADTFEPTRSYFNDAVGKALDEKSLDELFFMAIELKVGSCLRHRKPIYPDSLYQYQLMKGKFNGSGSF